MAQCLNVLTSVLIVVSVFGVDKRVVLDELSNCCYTFVGCLTSQQHASVSQGRICSDKFTCYRTET